MSQTASAKTLEAEILEFLDAMHCPEDADPQRFESAKAILRRIHTRQVSASMSGIEYHEPEATMISQALRVEFFGKGG